MALIEYLVVKDQRLITKERAVPSTRQARDPATRDAAARPKRKGVPARDHVTVLVMSRREAEPPQAAVVLIGFEILAADLGPGLRC